MIHRQCNQAYDARVPRASIYTAELAERICARLEVGEPLARICAAASMPGVRTVLRWASERPDFREEYDWARQAQGEHLDAEIQRIAETAVDRDTAQAARVQITALQWRAAKMAPRRFGDKIEVESTETFNLTQAIEAAKRRQAERRAAGEEQ